MSFLKAFGRAALLPLITAAPAAGARAEALVDGRVASVQTLPGLGATQGVTVYDGKVYLYGDADPGVIREYTMDGAYQLTATGRAVALTVNGVNVINHPTGLAFHEGAGWYLGNTVTATKKGTIYHLSWDRMWADGTLDAAILNVTDDDLAVQGCRPQFVRVGARWLVATADYGDVANAVRLYDPAALATARTTSAPGVVVAQFPTGPWVQNLSWLDDRGLLVVEENVTEGAGWRLTFVDLAASLAAASQQTKAVIDLTPQNEMEGFTMVDATHGLAASSSDQSNVALVSLAWH